MADESVAGSFCEVCGDAGGATRLIVCENADIGCLGGIHLYCCVPLRSEPPTDAWYCSECSQAREEMAARRQAAEEQRAAKRAAAEAARQQRQQEKRQQKLEARRLRSQQRQLTQPPADAPGAATARPSAPVPTAAQPVAAPAVATTLGSAAAGQLPVPAAQRTAGGGQPASGAGGGGVGRGAPAGAAAPAAAAAGTSGPRALPPSQAPSPQVLAQRRVASRDTLSLLFDSLNKEDAEQAQRMTRVVDGTSRRLQRSVSEREAAAARVREAHSLERCRAAGGVCWAGRLMLPLPQQRGSFEAPLVCYGIPGNPHSRQAAQHLVQLAAAAAQQQQQQAQKWPQPRILSMDELGIRQDQAYQEASLLLALGSSNGGGGPMQQQAGGQVASLWAALVGTLQRERQAVGILLPEPPEAAAAAAAAAGGGGGGGATAGAAGGSSSSSSRGGGGLFLALVPNVLDPGSLSLFGLIALPLQHLTSVPPAPGARPARGILRQRTRTGGSTEATPAAAAAASGQAAAAASSLATASTAASAASAARAMGPGRKQPVGWADSSFDDQPASPAAASLELAVGSHYATPVRRAAQAARPPRPRTIRSFDERGEAAAVAQPRPLEGLRVALVGYAKDHHFTLQVLDALKALGASTYTNQVVVADVLCLHPGCLAGGGMERNSAVLLGLAHLLASCPSLRVYADSSFLVLHEMIGLQRPLRGSEWRAERLKPVFPAGLLVVLDGHALRTMQARELEEVLSGVQQLRAGAPPEEQQCVWNVAAAPVDLTALHWAGMAGQEPAADNWRLWQQSSVARPLAREETSSSSNPGDPAPVVKHAVKAAKVDMHHCRLVYLCSSDAATLWQAEQQSTILSGGIPDLLHFLATFPRPA